MRELFPKAQDEVPTWSGTEVSLTESSLVIGNAEFLSDQEKGIDLLCRHENVRRLHAVLKYNRRLRGWILASLGGRCRVGSAQNNWPPYLAENPVDAGHASEHASGTSLVVELDRT